MARRALNAAVSPASALESAVQAALKVTKTARKHRLGLSANNFYANRLAELRADAVNAFRDLTSQSAGDTSAMAELIETVFSVAAPQNKRVLAGRELLFALRTTWRNQTPAPQASEGALFPLAILSQAGRGYLVTIGRQMNGCFTAGWHDACAVMMRRLLEIALIEAFENKGLAHKIKDGQGNYFHLSDLVGKAMAETSWTLSRNARLALPHLRDAGHLSAHGRYYTARKEDLEGIRQGCRIVIEEFLHHAGLL